MNECNQGKKLSVLRITQMIVLLFSWWGIVGNVISIRLGGVVYFLISLGVMLLSFYPGIVVIPNENRSLYRAVLIFIIFAVLYAILSVAFLKTAHNTTLLGIVIPVYTYNIIVNFPVWVANGILIARSISDDKKWMCKVIFWTTIYNIVITMLALYADPNYVRNSSAGIIDSSVSVYKIYGAMGYELSYSIAILVPMFFLMGKEYDKRWYLLSFLGTFFVIKSGFFIAIVAMSLNIILSISMSIKRNYIRYMLIGAVIIAGIYLAINQTIIGTILLRISSSMEIGDLQRRIYQVGSMLSFRDYTGDSLVRFELYERSIKGIIQSPVIGNLIFNSSFQLSDHSTILDTWAGYGILPTVMFIYSIIKMAEYSKKKTNSITGSNVVMSGYIVLIFIGLFNQLFVAPLIMLVPMVALPVFASLISRKSN